MTIALKQLLAEPLLPKDVMVGGYANAWRTSDMTGSGSEPKRLYLILMLVSAMRIPV